MEFLIPLFIAMLISVSCIPLLTSWAVYNNIFDKPGIRKIHTQPIPRIGGLAIIVATLIPILIWIPISSLSIAIIFGIILISIEGFYDDIKDLNYKWKFSAQFISACLVVFVGNISLPISEQINFLNNLSYLSPLLTVIFLIAVTNAMNLSDGLDGLAGGTSLISLSIITVLCVDSGNNFALIISLSLIGSILGFLRFNSYPAKIFMGDSGSQFLGFTIGVLILLLFNSKNQSYSPILALLLMGMPILDMLTVMVIRIKQNKSPFEADANHFHHRIIRAGFEHYHAVLIIYSFHLIFVICAYLYRHAGDFVIAFCFITLSICFLIITHLLIYTTAAAKKISPYSSNVWYFKNTPHFTFISKATILAITCYFIIKGLFANDASSFDIGLLSGFMLLTLIVGSIKLLKLNQELVIKFSAYTAIAVAFYLQYNKDFIEVLHLFEALILTIAAIFIFIDLVSKNSYLSANPLDFLVILITLIVPVLLLNKQGYSDISLFILKVVIVFYCVEFLFTKNDNFLNVLRISIGIFFFSLLTSFLFYFLNPTTKAFL